MRSLRRSSLLLALLALSLVLSITPVAAQDAPAFDWFGEPCFNPETFVFDGYKAGKAFTQPGVWHFMRVSPTTEDAVNRVGAYMMGGSPPYHTKVNVNAQGQLRVRVFYSGFISSLELHCLNVEGSESVGHMVVDGLQPPPMTELVYTDSGRLAKVTRAHVFWDATKFIHTRYEKVQLRFQLGILPQVCQLEFKHLGAPVPFRALSSTQMSQVVEVQLPALTPKQTVAGRTFQLEGSFDTIVIPTCTMGDHLYETTPRSYSIS